MNSRIENGTMTLSSIENGTITLPSKEEVIEEVYAWGNCEINEETDTYISYSDTMDTSRVIYFPKTDNVDRIKKNMIIDEKVKQYVNPDKVAEFIFNCIDVNALAALNTIALLYDEPILDENGEIEDWKETDARKKLYELTYDEYALEIGLELLGITWVERSTVIINISELVKTSEEIAKDIESTAYYSTDWEREFMPVFQEGLVSTICHEFRHLFYECNEFTPLGTDEYPTEGGLETNIEDYGNEQMELLMHDKNAKPFIDAMFQTKKG